MAYRFPWFCGLTSPEAGPFPQGVEAMAERVLAGPTGRPWLAGSWPEDAGLVVAAGPVTAVFLGLRRFDDARGRAAVEGAVRAGDFDALARLPGSFHVAVATPEATLVYGDPMGLRRVYHAELGGAVLFSDHAVVLARLTGASVDEGWLCTWLACPEHRNLLDGSSAFAGVRAVRPGHRLVARRDGRATTVGWWRLPDDERPLAETAPELRDRLDDAVAARVAGSARVSCDLSGGLDSTVLAFLAARHVEPGGSLLAFSQPPCSPANDDPPWARAAAAALGPAAVHVVPADGEWPLPGGDLEPVPLDEPALAVVNQARHRHLAAVLASHGSTVHLSGHGADQALIPPLAYLTHSLRHHPLRALAHLRGHVAVHACLSLAQFARLARPPTYRAWVEASAACVTGGPLPPPSWGQAPRVPPWLSPRGRELVRARLAEAAPTLEPLSSRVGQHAALDRVRDVAAVQRLLQDVHAGLGVRAAAPFLDHDVVETCMSTLSFERCEPDRVKPLLVEAMTGLVPGELLVRKTKGTFETDYCLGWRAHHGEIVSWFEESRLLATGLCDADALRKAIRPAVMLDFLRLTRINNSLACELWLRALETGPPAPPAARTAPAPALVATEALP